jgi:hypothetical protein
VIGVTRPTRKGERDKGRRCCAPQVKLRQIFFPTTGTTIKPIKTKSPNNNKVHYKHYFPFLQGENEERERAIHFEQPPETLRILHHFVLLRTLADHLLLPQRHRDPSHQSCLPAQLEFLTRNLIIFPSTRENLFWVVIIQKELEKEKKSLNSNCFLLDCDRVIIPWIIPKIRQITKQKKGNALDMYISNNTST